VCHVKGKLYWITKKGRQFTKAMRGALHQFRCGCHLLVTAERKSNTVSLNGMQRSGQLSGGTCSREATVHPASVASVTQPTGVG
jgi:hypothetical protein